MNKNIEIIAMIYKSVDYLNLISKQLKSDTLEVDGWSVGTRIVANDATKEVLQRLSELDIPYSIYNDPKPEDFYLNRVYRCWNYGGRTSTYDNICFVNSDMAFSKGWLANLLKHHNGKNMPCSRLVESGRIPVATERHGISKNFGASPKDFNQIAFENFVEEVKEDKAESWGLLMPCVFEKERFMDAGMYPEGNVFISGWRGGKPELEIGCPNDRKIYAPGDVYFFEKILTNKYKMKHITVFDSLVYHVQEGEMDEGE